LVNFEQAWGFGVDRRGKLLMRLVREGSQRSADSDPVIARLGRRYCAQKFTEILSAWLKLNSGCLDDEQMARQPRSVDPALAFLDVMLAYAELAIKADDTRDGPDHICHRTAGSRTCFLRTGASLGTGSSQNAPI